MVVAWHSCVMNVDMMYTAQTGVVDRYVQVYVWLIKRHPAMSPALCADVWNASTCIVTQKYTGNIAFICIVSNLANNVESLV